MRKALIRLLSWLGAFVALALVLNPINPAWGLLGLIVVPAIFLSLVDLGRAIRNALPRSRATYFLGLLFGIPQALFGLISLLGGLVIFVAFFFWPARGEGNNWIILIVAPLLMSFGVVWLREVLKSN